MTYEESLQFLEYLGHEVRGRKFDLTAIQTILESLGHPELRYPAAIVAGTNGKGSVSAMLASIFEAAGYRTGLYTSPHLVRVNERIRTAGREIEDEDFAGAMSEVRKRAETLLENGRLEPPPSFFEYLTAAAFLEFARESVDIAVLEVGMGGRLDATNVTNPAVAVITNVSLDHQEFLGPTVAAIAREKAGIIKAGRPAVTTAEDPDALRVLRERAAEMGAGLTEAASVAQASEVRDEKGYYRFHLTLGGESAGEIALPLAGEFQIRNALAAAAAVWRLRKEGWRISNEAVAKGIAGARWPGRLETIRKEPLVVLDGAHNIAAAREVARYARKEWRGRRVRLIYATMRDKDVAGITALLFPLAEEIYLTEPAVARAANAEEILATAQTPLAQVTIEPDPERALERALSASKPEDVILAAGSLFLVGALKKDSSARAHAARPSPIREAAASLS